MAKNTADQFIGMTEGYFEKAPALPKNWRDFIVKIVPWVALIFGLIGVLSSIGDLASANIFVVLSLVSSVLLLAAFPGLNSKKLSGWKLLFWSEIVGIASSILALAVIGVLMGLVGLYLIFQIKSYYK